MPLRADYASHADFIRYAAVERDSAQLLPPRHAASKTESITTDIVAAA